MVKEIYGGTANGGIALEISLWWSEGFGDASCCERRVGRYEKAGDESGSTHGDLEYWIKQIRYSEENTQAG